MKKGTYTGLLLGILALNACVRDEVPPCPPLQVEITVKDKNYFNVDKIPREQRKSEGLAFREYVPSLYYRLYNAVTGKVVEEQRLFGVTGDEKTYRVTFCDCIPHGTYVLTVWGGLRSEDPLGENAVSIGLHPGNTEGDDIYMVHDTLVYNAWNYNYTVGMQRVKGKLIIEVENLPGGMNYSDKTVEGLFGKLDHGFRYSEVTRVKTLREWRAGEDAVLTKTLLAPSVSENGSRLQAHFYDTPNRATTTLTPAEVNITMKRNELTALRYVYDDNTGGFDIYVLLNDSWDQIFDMGIEQ